VGTANRDFFKIVFGELEKTGLLLESDTRSPSVCSLIVGEPLRGSWWSHPQAHTIFWVNEQLEDHKDVLITKLIGGKVTFVHRRLWSCVMAIGKARADWQMRGLSTSAGSLLKAIDTAGQLRTDQLSWPRTARIKPGDAARELEKKLLIVAQQIHTDSGAHAKALETWPHWAKRVGFKSERIALEKAMERVNDRIERINMEFHAKLKLPWYG
jgi:hypothetical protein